MHSYLKWFVAGVAAAYAAVGAVNWLIDPFAIHSSPRIAGFNAMKPAILKHGRIFKTVVAAEGGWQALILGTSRADVGLDPQHPGFAGQRAFNAATANQPHEETWLMLEAAARSGTLRQAVIGLDFFASNPRYAAMPDYESANFRWWRRYQVMFSGDTLGESLWTLVRQDRQLMLREYGLWQADGRREFSLRAGSHRAAALGSDEAYVRSHYLYPYTFSYEGQEPLTFIRRAIAFAHERGIELKLLISPSHARQWETLAVDGLWPAWEEWKRRLVAMNDEEARKAGRAAFALWDFTGYNSVTTEPFPPLASAKPMKGYWESSHYRKEVGDLVLDRVFEVANSRAPADFGVRLKQETLEAHLQRIREGRAAWVKSFPEDAAEIRRISASYAAAANSAAKINDRVESQP